MSGLSRRLLLKGLSIVLASSPLWLKGRKPKAETAGTERKFVMVDGWILRHSDLEHLRAHDHAIHRL
ncbi:MAG: hypothetical protein R3C97_00410 [Geminicoccaceae bacterium]